jgi:hypothetical protein
MSISPTIDPIIIAAITPPDNPLLESELESELDGLLELE